MTSQPILDEIYPENFEPDENCCSEEGLTREKLERLREELNKGMRALCALRFRRAREIQPIDEEIDRLQELRARYSDPLANRIEDITSWLAVVMQTHRELESMLTGHPQATIRTPWGEVKSTTSKSWEWGDEGSLLTALKDARLDDLIRVTEAPAKTTIKNCDRLEVTEDGKVVVRETGEVLPIAVRPSTSVTVKPAGPETR